jgi:hypothetical protein
MNTVPPRSSSRKREKNSGGIPRSPQARAAPEEGCVFVVMLSHAKHLAFASSYEYRFFG